MNRLVKAKLEAIKDFQDKFPTSHVGGSFGLFLRGINLLRDLSASDLDITVDEILVDNFDSLEYQKRSDGIDFDYAIKKNLPNGLYVKIDIRVCPEPSFDEIIFEGVKYNVSKYRDIIFWKTKYAMKGVEKHIHDLEAIKSGVRPLQTFVTINELPDFKQ